MTKKRMLLVPAGEDKPQLVHLEANWRKMAKVIGCKYIERVRTQIPSLVFYCDEEFLLKSQWPAPNRVSTVLYPGPILGNVLVCREDQYQEIEDLNHILTEQLCRVLGYDPSDLIIHEQEKR